METTLEKKKIRAKMAATRIRIFEPIPRRPENEGIFPELKLIVVFGITTSVESVFLDLAVLTFTTYEEGEFFRARVGWECVTKHEVAGGDGR